MAKSSGARPRKAQREEVSRLKGKLAQIKSHEWQRAQVIFDEIVALCGVQGPSGAQMVPRACKSCGYFGHSRQFCPNSSKEAEQLKRWRLANPLPTRETTTPEHWAYIEDLRAIEERYDRMRAAGLGCDVGAYDPACACAGCKEWHLLKPSF